MFVSVVRRCAKPRSFPKQYFDLKAFRRGITEKKQSLLAAEKREIDRVFAKPAPEGWSVQTLLEKANLVSDNTSEDSKQFLSQVAACFDSWNDLVSSSRKDLFRVSHLLSADQIKKLATAIELFNHGLLGLSKPEVQAAFAGKPLRNENAPWTAEDDGKLIELAVEKYDFTFGDVWLYVSWEMQRSMDQVRDRFVEIYLKPHHAKKNDCEILLSKSYRPLLMNRQFRLVPPQCYIVPSDNNFPSVPAQFELPEPFRKYRNSEAFTV
jgi:hypothetical protein